MIPLGSTHVGLITISGFVCLSDFASSGIA